MFGLEAIWRDGHVVGHVRRADFGFAIDKTLAYGYIRDPSGGPVSPVLWPCEGAGACVSWDPCHAGSPAVSGVCASWPRLPPFPFSHPALSCQD